MKNKLFLLLTLLSSPIVSFSQATCATAQVVNAGQYTVTAVDGTEIPTPVCATGGTGATAGKWYKYTAPANYTVTVTADFPANGSVDTRLHIYTGSCGALFCVAGDDDSGSGLLSVASFQATSGTDYYIAFDNKWSSLGFIFEIQETPPAVSNPNDVTFTGQNISTITGDYKIAIADMNADLLDDIVTVSSTNVQIHYQQSNGTFNPVNIPTTPATNLPTWSMAIADYNKDGYGDLLYGGGSGVTFMRSSNNGTQFTQISGPQYVFSQRSNFTDFNNDGNLDAFVCHDVAPTVHFHNDGSGNLTFMQGGMGDHPNGGNYGSIWVDYNNDGFSDLFIAKCRGGFNTAKINELHRNNGDGTFTNVSASSGMADSVQTWSSAWNDFNNDGFLDAVVGASSFTDGKHKFMINNGNGTFSNITAGSGLENFLHQSIEYVSYDFNNDGWADVLTDGYILFNNGDSTFTSKAIGFNVGAVGDLNNDGFLDVQNGSTIFFNDKNNNNWTTLQLKGIQSNSNGIGARVECYGSWGKQIRDVQSGVGFRHMGTMNVHIGIGTATSIDSIIVRWPSGEVDFICQPAINTPFILIEGSSSSPISAFNSSASVIPQGTTITFTDASTNCPNAWEWNVGPSTGWTYINGTNSTSQNPQIQFTIPGWYEIQLTASNSNGTSSIIAKDTIQVTSTAGITDLAFSEISIYPNPTENVLHINSSLAIKHISIIDLSGKEILTIQNPTKSIHVNQLESGTYMIEVSIENGTISRQKFTKY